MGILMLLAGCSPAYLLQAAGGQWRLMRARVPVAQVLADGSRDATLRARLALVQEARDYASRELGLPDNGSYRSYAALHRPYAVWNVVATPEFSVRPLRWCFPVTGCISYRGYFREDRARRYAARLAARGDDTLVAGVSAYSTLGHFADPLLDTMMRYDDATLVGTMFHELAHQLVYVRGDTAFNEAFAMSVERAGLARWLAARGEEGRYARWRQAQELQAQVARRFAAARAALAQLYAAGGQPSAMRERKRSLLAALADGVRADEQQRGMASGYGPWLEAGLNNAHLAAVGTYMDCVPAFERMLAARGGDLAAWHGDVRRLARGPASARRALCAQAP